MRGWKKQASGNHPLKPAETTTFVATSVFGDCASVLMVRNKGGEVVSYNFVRKQVGGKWLILREFTFQDALPQPQ